MRFFHPDPKITKFSYMVETYQLDRGKKNPFPIKSFLYTRNHSFIMLNLLDNVMEGCILVYDDTLEIGFLNIVITDRRVFLKKVHVHKNYRYEGIARNMMNLLIDWCRFKAFDSLELYPSAPEDEEIAAKEKRLSLSQLRSYYQSFGLTQEKGRNLWNTTDQLIPRRHLDL